MTDATTADGTCIMAVGGHIGDMDLAAGPVLAQNVLDGGRSVLVALTPGERGHPTLAVEDYQRQKIAEGEAFAAGIGAEFVVFDDQSDGMLQPTEDLAARLALLIREYRPRVLVAHWGGSMHSDHTNAGLLAERARFLAGLPGWRTEGEGDAARRHGVARLLYSENWEDSAGFVAAHHLPVGVEAYERWSAAIQGEAFARGETYGFRYIDYYTALHTMRGCLARTERAVGFGAERNFLTSPISLT